MLFKFKIYDIFVDITHFAYSNFQQIQFKSFFTTLKWLTSVFINFGTDTLLERLYTYISQASQNFWEMSQILLWTFIKI